MAMETDAARGAPERPSAPPTSARAAPVASTSDPQPEVGTRDAVETMTFPAFPHEPYGIQLELMRSLYATLRRGGIGVFESPTGTGKTLSVLCSALQWLEDERKANARGDTTKESNAAAADGSDEPDWLRDFASNKRGRDASDRETRRKARREEARRRAAEADRAFFDARGLNASERGAFGGGGFKKKSSTKSKAAAEAAAVAAYAAAVSRGASRDDAIEEAEFLADDWSDETGLANSGASLKYLRGDDTSSDEDADAKNKNVKRFRSSKSSKTARLKTFEADSEDSEDDAPSQQIIFCSRTHSQLTQVVGELRSTAFGKPAGAGEEDRLVSAVAVAGRRQLCVNRDALETAGASASRLNERCLELAEEGRKAKGRKKAKDAKDAKGTDEEPADKKQKGVAEKGCPFLRKRRAAVSELAEEALATPMDIEDLAAAGVKRKACPYYAAREAHPRADLIFAPYASLLHAETRDSLGIRLKDAVVVFDEAHNLAEAVHGAHGATITGKQIQAVFQMVDAYVERFYSRLSPSNLRHLKTLKALCAAFGKALEDDAAPDTSNDSATPTVVKTLNDFLFDAGADAVNVFALTKYLKESKIAHKIAGYGERARANTASDEKISGASNASQKNAWDWSDDDADIDLGVAAVVRRDTIASRHQNTHQKTPRVGSVHALAAFVSALAAADADGRVLVEKKEQNASASKPDLDSARSPGGRLKFVLLDAAARFRAVVDQARAVVLVGGTLSPIDELAAQLFPDCAPVRGGSADADPAGDPVAKTSAEPSAANDRNALRVSRPTPDPKPLFSLSLGHVVPRDALLPLAVGVGPSGLTLDFSFGKRDDEKMIDELGRIVANACAVTPGGAVVFFPSFAYADKVYTRWTHTGTTQRIARLKTVFREPRNAADVETALRSFSDAVARFSSRETTEGDASRSVSNAVHKPTQTGALMLCVCGGKLSEGINFKDALGRLVVMVGLPYANPEEPELKARMAYLDERERAFFFDEQKNKNERAKTRGRRYYEALCMRSVNQSVGRAIRHVGDYAAILFCDRRYVTAPSTKETNERERDGNEKLRGVPAQLAGWIGERLVTPSGYGQTQASLARFFAGKRKNMA